MRAMKRGVYLYLTTEYVDELKKRGANISKLVDDHLKKLIVRKSARMPLEKLIETNPKVKEILDYGRAHLEYHRDHPEIARQWYEEAANVLGISVRRLKRFIEGGS